MIRMLNEFDVLDDRPKKEPYVYTKNEYTKNRFKTLVRFKTVDGIEHAITPYDLDFNTGMTRIKYGGYINLHPTDAKINIIIDTADVHYFEDYNNNNFTITVCDDNNRVLTFRECFVYYISFGDKNSCTNITLVPTSIST